MNTISKSFKKATEILNANQEETYSENGIESVYHLSKNGKNVVVLFLDRAINNFLPYAIEKVPELKEQLRGFINFSNTISYSSSTDLASPAMMGGYEYTPERINERNKLLKEVHNEATLVAPILFRDAGYSVTITDPPFPNYSWRGDLSIIRSYEGITATELYGKYSDLYEIDSTKEERSTITKTQAVNFSVLQALPPIFRYTFETSCRTYSEPNYFENLYDYISAFSSLYFFSDLTDFTAKGNTYTFIGNESTHEPVSLNASLLHSASDDDKFESNYPSTDESTYQHYSVFVASLKAIGEWLDYLRENSCYDNTRIIIVSDHGRGIDSGGTINTNMMSFTPLFLYKDFNSNDEFSYDTTFMTNADTILLATKDLEGISTINPFTGNKLKEDKENGVNIYHAFEKEWNAPTLYDRKEFTLVDSNGFHVKNGNVYSETNWVPLTEWEEKEE